MKLKLQKSRGYTYRRITVALYAAALTWGVYFGSLLFTQSLGVIPAALVVLCTAFGAFGLMLYAEVCRGIAITEFESNKRREHYNQLQEMRNK